MKPLRSSTSIWLICINSSDNSTQTQQFYDLKRMRTYFEDLFTYHRWANEALIDTMARASTLPPAAAPLFSHLLNAHGIWLDRIEQYRPTFAVWQEHAREDWVSIMKPMYERTTQILCSDKYGNQFEASVHYQNTQGARFQNSVQEILTHVSNHTTHHRAQVARELRQHHITPPATDYIFFKRNPIIE